MDRSRPFPSSVSSMNSCALLLLLGTLLHGAAATVHTYRLFETSSTLPNFPEFISVAYVDDLQIEHYDSVTKRDVPKQEWMKKLTEEDPQYWETETQKALVNEEVGKVDIEIAKQRLNVTGGLHINQFMYGCDWDDETGHITGYHQFAFDGEDFISFDFETETFVAPKQEAFITKLRWETFGEGFRMKNLIIHDCVEYLKKYVRLGESALKRTERPLVSLLQKSSSAPVTCHATDFYPDRALLFWTKDGHELMEDEDVDPGEVLPNGDGTFQTSVSLDLSSVPPEDWDRFHCVFQLSGVKDDYVTRLDRTKIRTNSRTDSRTNSRTDSRTDIRTNSRADESLTGLILGSAVAVVLAAVVSAFGLCRRHRAKLLAPPPSETELLPEYLKTDLKTFGQIDDSSKIHFKELKD